MNLEDAGFSYMTGVYVCTWSYMCVQPRAHSRTVICRAVMLIRRLSRFYGMKELQKKIPNAKFSINISIYL